MPWFDVPAVIRVEANDADAANELAGRRSDELHRAEGWSVLIADGEPIDVTEEVEQ